jgi:predicted 3-demethylubiquinone-9 3-methyltransferase (glyoxalase superfamily)
MQGISTFIWFDGKAVAASEYYVAVFPNSRITSSTTFPDPRPGVDAIVGLVTFELDGRPFTALDGGPVFELTPAISFVITCEDQAEVDYYWSALTDGGEESQCGWLVDRFGVSWQVVPSVLGSLLGGPDREGAARANAAMMPMRKLDIATLQAAYEGR